MHLIKSKQNIRQILIDNDITGSYEKEKLLHRLEGSDIYEGLGDEGSSVVMNIEMNKIVHSSNDNNGKISKNKKIKNSKINKKGKSDK